MYKNNALHNNQSVLPYDIPIRWILNNDNTGYRIFKENSSDENWSLTKRDVDFVMNQSGCTEEQAIRSLINNDLDTFNAIMEMAT